MAYFEFNCPSCGQKLRVDESQRDKRMKCPKCQQQFVLPEREKTKRKEEGHPWFFWCLRRPLAKISTLIKSVSFWIILFLLVFIFGYFWMSLNGCFRPPEIKHPNANTKSSAPAPVAKKKSEVKKSETTVTVKLNLYDNGNNRINPMFGIWVYRDEEFIDEAQRLFNEIDKAYGEVFKASNDITKGFAEIRVLNAKKFLVNHCIHNFNKAVAFKERERSGSYTFRINHSDRLPVYGGRCFIFLDIKYYNQNYFVFKLIDLYGADKTLEITNDDLLSF